MISNFWEIPGICSEQSLAFLEHFFDPLCVYNKQGKPIHASPGFLKLLRTPIAAVDFFDFFCSIPTDIATLTGYWRRAIAGETVRFSFRPGDSSREIACLLQFNPGANVMFLRIQQAIAELDLRNQDSAVLLEDITENRKIYNALVRTEEKWKAFVLNSLHLFIQMSHTGQIVYASPAVERVLGYREEELLDRPVANLIHPDDLNQLKLALHLWTQEIQSDQSGLECRWRAKSGRWVYLYIQGKRFPFGLNIDGMILSGYNITRRKRLEVELNASEERFNFLARNISGVMFQSDSTDRMISVSAGIEELTGYPATDFINNQVRSYISLVHPDDLEFLSHSIVAGAVDNRLLEMEYRIIDANGETRWILERRQGVLAPDGQLLRFDGVLLEVSDRKRLEQELAQARADLQEKAVQRRMR